MDQEAQKVAMPPFLRKRLQAFRIGDGEQQSYLIVDQIDGKQYEFEHWQFFILQILPGCDDFTKLSAVFEDRFGHSISNDEVESLFSLVADNKLFAPFAAFPPILEAFNKKRDAQVNEGDVPETSDSDTGPAKSQNAEQSKLKTPKPDDAEKNTGSSASELKDDDKKPLPAGVKDAMGLDDSIPSKHWNLFNPTRYIKHCYPWVLPLKHIVYVMPILLMAALIISVRYIDFIVEDFTFLRHSLSFAVHVLIGMFTVNLLATLVTAFVAYTYRATVNSFCIVLRMGFFPRFMVRLSHVDQFSRRERLWLHAAPLIARLVLFSLCILLWFTTRTSDGFLTNYGLVVAGLSICSFFIAANPLIKSSGYHLLATFMDEPALRIKAYMALLSKIRPNSYKKNDNNILTAYALTSSLFMVIAVTVFIFLFGRFLETSLGGTSLLLIGIIVVSLLLGAWKKFKEISQTYERSIQFERWRKRTLPEVENKIEVPEKKKGAVTFLKRALFFTFLIVLFVPYNYEIGGKFIVLPKMQQNITAEIAGIIDEINFDGGEILKKGTEIGRLSYSDYSSQVNIFNAKIQQQQAVINELKSRPKSEEIQLAQRALEVERTRAQFSKEKVIRLENLYSNKTISFEDLEETRREHEIDLNQVEEKLAYLELVKSGTPPDQIIAEEAKLQSLKEQRDHNLDKIEQSIFRMPFDGKLITLNLKQRVGSYLGKGEMLCIAENADTVKAQIEVIESGIGYISESEKVRIRPHAYHSEDFIGIISKIDAHVTEVRTGKVVKVITVIDNKDGRLKTGMTGYAKISCGYLPTWKVLTLTLFHFINVEAWSWLP